MKYAYLIIANQNPNQLQELITMIDDSRNDIYLIKDNKSKDIIYNFHTNFSSIYYLRPINIYWGNYSIVDAELRLFKASYPKHYTYYHLLSGLDLPLVNQDIVHGFFDNHQNKEFLGYGDYNNVKKMNNDIYLRIKHHFFRKHYKSKNIIEKIYRGIERRSLKYLFNNIIPKDKIGYASQWLSIDDDLVSIIIHSSKWIRRVFWYSICPDEIFIPTIINYHPSILRKIYYNGSYDVNTKEFTGNLRYIKFNTSYSPSPHVWTNRDYGELVKAKKKGYLFSRKFNSREDNKIIKHVFHDVMES